MLNHTATRTRTPGRVFPMLHYTQHLLDKYSCSGACPWPYKNVGAFALNTRNVQVHSFQQWHLGIEIFTSIWKAKWLKRYVPFCCKTIYRRLNLFKTAPWCMIGSTVRSGVFLDWVLILWHVKHRQNTPCTNVSLPCSWQSCTGRDFCMQSCH